MSEGIDWLEDTVPVDLHFYKDNKGRKILIVDEEEMQRFRDDVATQRKQWEHAKEKLAAKIAEETDDARRELDQERLEQIERLIGQAEASMARVEAQHAERMAAPITETYHLLPYSYYDRLEAEDKFTTVNPVTQESERNEDRVRDALLLEVIKGVTRANKDGVSETIQLQQSMIRRLPGPIAQRLWKSAIEWSEPSEAETFRLRLGLG